MGSSSAYLTAQDTLKWGQFLLNNGTVGNTQILPKWWMSHSTEVTPAYLKGRMITSPEDRMSRQWWINRSVPSLNADKAWGNAPEDTYAASGHWGQRLIVIPSEDMIIVRYGEDKEEGTFKTNTLLRLARQLAQNRTLPDIDTSEANAHLVTEHYDPGLSYGGWPKKLAEIKLFGAYKAKEYCSCFYVMKQTAEYCKEFVKNKAVPGFLAPLRHNEKQKEVGVNSHTARFISEQYGCKLIN